MIPDRLKILLTGILLLGHVMMNGTQTQAQDKLTWTTLPALPGEGWAGMFAGVSNGTLFCMGGANFPGKRPWEGGKKKWYDNIYRLEKGKGWVLLKEKLPLPLAYGIAVNYGNQMIIVGGSSPDSYSRQVIGFSWEHQQLSQTRYPDLPVPLANMAGALTGSLLIVAGGNSSITGPPLSEMYALDLVNPANGWFELPSCPGPQRLLPVCGVYNGKFYLFSGENTGKNAKHGSFRHILQDAYCFTPVWSDNKWSGTWQQLGPMPRGASAGASPLPVLQDGSLLLWGGVDAVTALYETPATHPGITRSVLRYYPEKDSWKYDSTMINISARVTLPVTYWENKWIYISGEIKPGTRTNTVYAVQ